MKLQVLKTLNSTIILKFFIQSIILQFFSRNVPHNVIKLIFVPTKDIAKNGQPLTNSRIVIRIQNTNQNLHKLNLFKKIVNVHRFNAQQ